jgi:cytidylate kinase
MMLYLTIILQGRGSAMKEIFSIDKAVAYQESNWKQRKNSIDIGEKHAFPFITISREYGCLAHNVGDEISKILNMEYLHDPLWTVYDRSLLDRIMNDMKISYELAETLTDKARSSVADLLQTTFSKYLPEVMVYKKLIETIRIIAANGHAVIIGRVGNVITSNLPHGYHVRLIASDEKKIENISRHFNISKKDAKDTLSKKGEVREQFILKRLKVNMTDPSMYDIIINMNSLNFEDTARLILKGMEISGHIKHNP